MGAPLLANASASTTLAVQPHACHSLTLATRNRVRKTRDTWSGSGGERVKIKVRYFTTTVKKSPLCGTSGYSKLGMLKCGITPPWVVFIRGCDFVPESLYFTRFLMASSAQHVDPLPPYNKDALMPRSTPCRVLPPRAPRSARAPRAAAPPGAAARTATPSVGAWAGTCGQ